MMGGEEIGTYLSHFIVRGEFEAAHLGANWSGSGNSEGFLPFLGGRVCTENDRACYNLAGSPAIRLVGCLKDVENHIP